MSTESELIRTAAWRAEQAQRRKQPGNCSRCGRVNDIPQKTKVKRGICSICRAKNKEYKEDAWKIRHLPKEVDMLKLIRRITKIEMRVETIREAMRAGYRQGYVAGKKTAVKFHAEKPAEWDAWKQPMDMEDKKQHFHRVKGACNE